MVYQLFHSSTNRRVNVLRDAGPVRVVLRERGPLLELLYSSPIRDILGEQRADWHPSLFYSLA